MQCNDEAALIVGRDDGSQGMHQVHIRNFVGFLRENRLRQRREAAVLFRDTRIGFLYTGQEPG